MAAGGGEAGGTVEVAATDETSFRAMFLDRFGGGPLAGLVGKATRNYRRLRKKVLADPVGIDRKDMPVIDRRHVERLHHALVKGHFDVAPPYDRHLARLLPAGAGLLVPTAAEIAESKRLAKAWAHSGDHRRDRVNARYDEWRARKLEPIQRQIYLDKVFDNMAEIVAAHPHQTVLHLERHFRATTLVVSGDKRIIDGNHRWATMMVCAPRFRLNCLVIDLPLDTLLKVSLAFTGLIGNRPNG